MEGRCRARSPHIQISGTVTEAFPQHRESSPAPSIWAAPRRDRRGRKLSSFKFHAMGRGVGINSGRDGIGGMVLAEEHA